MPGESSDISTMPGAGVKAQQRSLQKKHLRNKATVFVTNLPENDDVLKVVREHLESCGNINSVKESDIKKEGGNVIKRVSVEFSKKEEAKQATLLTGSVLEDRHIFISKQLQYTPSAKTVVVSNLSPDVIEEDLWQSFRRCGPISYIELVWNKNQSIDAQIYFKHESDAKKALLKDKTLVKQKVVSLSCARLEITNEAHDPVVVTKVSEDSRDDLQEEFGQYGEIKRIKFNRNRTYASIFYEDQKSADEAVKNSGRAEYRFKSLPNSSGLVNPLFIAGAPKEAKDVDLFMKFQVCGLIHGIQHVNNKGDFIIQFKEAESVKKALALEKTIHGHKLLVGTSVNIFKGHVEVPTPDKASSSGTPLKRKAGQIVGKKCVKTGDNASDVDVNTSLSSKVQKKKKVNNVEVPTPDKASSSGKPLKRKAGQIVGKKCVKTGDNASDVDVNTSLSSKVQKKKKVNNGAVNAFSVAAM